MMILRIAIVSVVACVGISGVARAEAGDPRLGRLYFRSVCTECHVRMIGKAIPPNTKTVAEWTGYMDADRHDASNRPESKLSHFTSRAFRQSIRAENKVADKFIAVEDAHMFANVRAWLIGSAKDSDNPASCD